VAVMQAHSQCLPSMSPVSLSYVVHACVLMCVCCLHVTFNQDNFCVKAGNHVRLVSPDLDNTPASGSTSTTQGPPSPSSTHGPPSPGPPSAANGQHAPPILKGDCAAYQQLTITYDGLHGLVQVGDVLYLVGKLTARLPRSIPFMSS
jgi:hypothetical protein